MLHLVLFEITLFLFSELNNFLSFLIAKQKCVCLNSSYEIILLFQVNRVQEGSSGVRLGQCQSSGIQGDQVGPSKVKWDQVRSNEVS
jgi:hypothetical protein